LPPEDNAALYKDKPIDLDRFLAEFAETQTGAQSAKILGDGQFGDNSHNVDIREA